MGQTWNLSPRVVEKSNFVAPENPTVKTRIKKERKEFIFNVEERFSLLLDNQVRRKDNERIFVAHIYTDSQIMIHTEQAILSIITSCF